MALSPGTRLGPYEIVAPLGAGSEVPGHDSRRNRGALGATSRERFYVTNDGALAPAQDASAAAQSPTIVLNWAEGLAKE